MINRKQHVILTAQRLFLEKGFAVTSVQDILDESGISKGTFYNYFSSKNECLIAILERAQEEALIRRKEMLIGKNLNDKKVFAKQVVVRMQVNREHNLIPLFEAIFHSKNCDLRNFVKKQHVMELAWLSNRFIDIYGQDIQPYSMDCAVIVLGLIQQYNLVWSFHSENELDPNKLVNFVLRRMDAVASDMIHTQDNLIGDHLFLYVQNNANEISCSKKQIMKELKDLLNLLKEEQKGKQLVEFIMTELSLEQPRTFLLESIIRSFHEYVIGSPVEFIGKKLTLKLFQYLKTLER